FTFGDWHLNVGFSDKTDDHSYVDPTYGVLHDEPLMPYEAYASVMGVDYTVTDGFTLNASYTHLDEATGLLGAQGGGALSLSGGAATNAVTVGATAGLFDGVTFTGSATVARTGASRFDRSALSMTGPIDSTAYEVALMKHSVFGVGDTMRLSIAQPLH